MILNSREITSATLPSGISNRAPDSVLSAVSVGSARTCLGLWTASASSSTKRLSNRSGLCVDGAGHLGVPRIWRIFSAFHRCCSGTLFIVLHRTASPFAFITMCSPDLAICPTQTASMQRGASFLFCFFTFPFCCRLNASFAKTISPISTIGLLNFLRITLSIGVIPSDPTLK